MAPKKAGGRPRKYSTVAEARQANLEGNRRRRQQQRQLAGPVDFIAYEPQLHADIPIETSLAMGLRTSRDIQIPPDPNAQQDEVQPSPRPNPQPSATNDNTELSEQIRRIRIIEQETNTEQAERDTEIAAILLGMRAAEQVEDIIEGERMTEERRMAAAERMAEEESITEERRMAAAERIAAAESMIEERQIAAAESMTEERRIAVAERMAAVERIAEEERITKER